jgi:integrase
MITYNHYVQAIDGFARWLVATNRLAANPLVALVRLNSEVDVRHKRRALTVDEVSKLIESAQNSGKPVQGYDGTLRGRAYAFSYLTGLRRREMGLLTPSDFDLDADQPIVTVEASNSKHRKKDVLPLHPELVTELRLWFPSLSPDEPLFPRFEKKKTWLMVKKDLERVGIPYETKDGVADFHAAGRHSHVTGLVKGGASVAEAKSLARHSDVRTTMNYTHVDMDDRSKALAGLAAPAQRMRSVSRCASGQEQSPAGNGSHNTEQKAADGSPSAKGVSDPPCQEMTKGDEPCSSPPVRWRRRESNPRPEIHPWQLLRV